MKNNTTSFTMLYSHDHTNDTKLMFTKTADLAEIELAFTSEDEDYGTEILIYGGGPTETFMSLCKKQLNELTTFLDASRGGTWRLDEIMESYKHFDGLNNSSLIAFERMLQEIVDANQCKEVRVKTSIGTLVARTHHCDSYPGIYVGLDRNGEHFGTALIEVDQDDPENPVLKAHVYNADPHKEEPEFDKHITPDEIDYYFAETKF